MHNQEKINKLVFWSIASLYGFAILDAIFLFTTSIDSFFILMYVSIICLIALFLKKEWRKDVPAAALNTFYVLLLINLIAFIRGFLDVAGYLEWKLMLIGSTGGLSMFIPLAVIVGVNYQYSGRLLKLCTLILKYSFLIFPILIGFSIYYEAYSKIVIPVIFFVLLIPYIKSKEKLIFLVVAVLSAVAAITWRSNIIHMVISIGLLSVFYFRRWISVNFLTMIQVLACLIPCYYMYMGVVKGKSVFAAEDDKEYRLGASNESENLLADTRTVLYQEVLTDLVGSKTILYGKGANAKYKSEIFDEAIYQKGRNNVEVGLLNILLFQGVIGFIIQSLSLFMAVYYGTRRSRNTLTKILAMFLVSHWIILFIENSVSYSLYFYFTWMAVGLCYSKKFRSLTDSQLYRLLQRGLTKISTN